MQGIWTDKPKDGDPTETRDDPTEVQIGGRQQNLTWIVNICKKYIYWSQNPSF